MTQIVALIIAAIALSISVTADSPAPKLVIRGFSDNTCTNDPQVYKVTTHQCYSIADECDGHKDPFACGIQQRFFKEAKSFYTTCTEDKMDLRVYMDEECKEPASSAFDYFSFQNNVCFGQVQGVNLPIKFECKMPKGGKKSSGILP
jgi:hypothetical protein